VNIVSRSSGRSSVASAAYRAGERIYDHQADLTHDYSRKSGVMLAEVMTPDGQGMERGHLWNLVEETEKRKNSTLAREIVIALPCELNSQEQTALAKEYAQGLSERTGWAVDVAVHEAGRGGDSRNVHAHLLCTTRRFERDENGCPMLKEKTRDWDVRATGAELIKGERKEWENCINLALERSNVQDRVDCRSHKERETGLEPLIHLGPAAMNMERKGVQTQRGELYREIARNNGQVVSLDRFRVEREEEQDWRHQFNCANARGFNDLQKVMNDEHPGSLSQTLERVPAVKETRSELDTEIQALRDCNNELTETLKDYYETLSKREGTKKDHPYVYRLAQWNVNLDSGVSSVIERERSLEQKLDNLLEKGTEHLERFDAAFDAYQKALDYHQWTVGETYEKLKERYDEGYGKLFEHYKDAAASYCRHAESDAKESDPYKALESVKALHERFPTLLFSGVEKTEAEENRLRGDISGYQRSQEVLNQNALRADRRQEDWKQSHNVNAVLHTLSLSNDRPLSFMEKEGWFARERVKRLSKLEQHTEGRVKTLKKELEEEKAKTTPELEQGKHHKAFYEREIGHTHGLCLQRVEKAREHERELKRQQEAEKQREREKEWQKQLHRERSQENYLGR